MECSRNQIARMLNVKRSSRMIFMAKNVVETGKMIFKSLEDKYLKIFKSFVFFWNWDNNN